MGQGHATLARADTGGATRDAVYAALGMLDDGSARVAEPLGDHQWQVNQWLKKAVLLSFRLNDMAVIPSGTSYLGNGESGGVVIGCSCGNGLISNGIKVVVGISVVNGDSDC